MFSDKTLYSIQMSKTITYYFRFIDELYHLIESELASEKREKNREKLEIIRMKYKKYQNNMMQKLREVTIYPGMSNFHLFMRMQIFQ